MGRWIFATSQLLAIHRVADQMAIRHIASGLEGGALAFYEAWCRRIPQQEWTWAAFSQALREEYEPPHYQFTLRKELWRLKQTGSIREYVQKFREITNDIEEMNMIDMVHAFIAGLRENIARELNYLAPESIEVAIQAAINYAGAKVNVTKSQTTPMELGPVDLEEGAELAKLDGHKPKKNGRLKCFECGGFGHFARECANRKKKKDKGTKKEDFRENP